MEYFDSKVKESLIEEKYLFRFNPSDCNKLYFNELIGLLDKTKPESENYKRTTIKNAKKHIKTLECSYPELTNCEKDEFFFNSNKQILLGRYFDTMPCFYECKENYFIMSMNVYSFFKNDLFIRYMIDKPQIFIREKNIKLETVFPVRVLLSKEHKIPTHKTRKIKEKDFLDLFIRNTIKEKNAISVDDKKIVENIPKKSILHQIITSKIPINHVIARELCILYFLDIFFYAVFDDNKPRPFLLCSKYNPSQIRKIYSMFEKPMPDIRLFMKKGKIKEDNRLLKQICIKYDFVTLTKDYIPAVSYVFSEIKTIDKEKFIHTLKYMWEYVGYFYLFTSNSDGEVKAFFFQNRNERREVRELYDRLKKIHGNHTKKYLESDVPKEKSKRIKDYFALINKECNDYCNESYHKLPANKLNDWVIMNTIVWAHNYSYKASDYYGSTLLNMFTSCIKKYHLSSNIFFVNYFDGPVLHKKYKYYLVPNKVKHNIQDYYPIYSPNTTEEHADIPVPFPDSWEIASGMRFGDTCRSTFQEKPKIVPFDKKKEMLFFRGTNTSIQPNNPSINTRLYCLGLLEKHKDEFPKDFLNIGLTSLINSTFIYSDGTIDFSKLEQIEKIIPNFSFKEYVPMSNQSEFKYILEMEGVSSSWRLPYMLQLKSCVVHVDSKFKRWFESFPDFKDAVYHTSKEKIVENLKKISQNNTLSEKIAENGYSFFKKYLQKDSILDYLHSVLVGSNVRN